MINYYWESKDSCGDFLAKSDDRAKEIAKGIKDLLVLYKENGEGDRMIILWEHNSVVK